MNDFDTDEDWDDIEDDGQYPLSGYDIVGIVVTGIGNVGIAISNVFGLIGNELFAAARHQRAERERIERLAMDRADFNDIISRPMSFGDPRG